MITHGRLSTGREISCLFFPPIGRNKWRHISRNIRRIPLVGNVHVCFHPSSLRQLSWPIRSAEITWSDVQNSVQSTALTNKVGFLGPYWSRSCTAPMHLLHILCSVVIYLDIYHIYISRYIPRSIFSFTSYRDRTKMLVTGYVSFWFRCLPNKTISEDGKIPF